MKDENYEILLAIKKLEEKIVKTENFFDRLILTKEIDRLSLKLK